MAASGRAILQAHVDGLLPESIPVDLQWTLTNGVIGLIPNATLSSGDNTVAVPSGTKLIIMIPPTTNAATLKWKFAGGETGITQLPNMPNITSWNAGVVIINASTSVNPVTFIFLG